MPASLILHTKQFGFKHGEALLMADSWRGPYRLSDSNARWRGSTANAEDSWHQELVEGNPMCRAATHGAPTALHGPISPCERSAAQQL